MQQLTLKALRVNANKTQKEVAEILDVDRKTVSNWENGVTLPTPKFIAQLCNIYNCSYDNIIFCKNKTL